MATYHFSVKIVRRSKRQNVVAKAAYNARDCLVSELTGKKYDYRYKGKAIFVSTEIPEKSPEWLKDLANNRQKLWDTFESKEKRKDAQLAREIVVSLPHELSEEDWRKLVLDFGREFVRRGMVADIAIHPPNAKGDRRNVHCHILLSLRDIEENGFGKKNRSWNSKILMRAWRRRWAEMVNLLLLEREIESQVDHRSFKDRGLQQEPTIYLGPKITSKERQGIKTLRGDRLRDIKKRNQSLLQSPVKEEDKELRPRKHLTDKLMITHKKRCALQRIQRDIRKGRSVSDQDIKALPEKDQAELTSRGFDYLQDLLRQQELGREREENER